MPKVPYVDGIVFRPTCRKLLDATDFGVVDARFVATVRRVRSELAACTDRQRARGARRILRRILEQAEDIDELIIDTRAAQVGALTLGFNIRVTMPLLVGADAAIPRVGHLNAGDAWHQLARYRDPDVGAVAALYHGGFDAEAISALTLADVHVHTDGRVTVGSPDTPVTFSGQQARFLRALVVYRTLTAESSRSQLFHTHRGERIRPSHVATMLTAPATEVGVALAAIPVRTTRLADELWLARHGITVELITRHDAKHLRVSPTAPAARP